MYLVRVRVIIRVRVRVRNAFRVSIVVKFLYFL